MEKTLNEDFLTSVMETFLHRQTPTAARVQMHIRVARFLPDFAPHRRVALDELEAWGRYGFQVGERSGRNRDVTETWLEYNSLGQ